MCEFFTACEVGCSGSLYGLPKGYCCEERLCILWLSVTSSGIYLMVDINFDCTIDESF